MPFLVQACFIYEIKAVYICWQSIRSLPKRTTMYRQIQNTILVLLLISACGTAPEKIPSVNEQVLAAKYFDTDAQWYIDNVPFFECSDKQIEEVYYYRWKLYKAHIRNTGPDEYVITEFINHVPWDREPYCTINAASMHHIYEGRWLKDDRFMNGYINNLYQQGGNNRRYSESIADASYARYLVNGDGDFIKNQLDSMIAVYEGWSDHWDSSKQLYYIPAMPDATEYTIASIDASGGKDGFEGGDAFRPTINSYMWANAMAISSIAALKGDSAISRKYFDKAAALRKNIEENLWNDSLQHFTDRLKVNNQFVKFWDFIRGRELAGIIPWYFNLPSDNPRFNQAWKHIIDTNQLLGQYGLRTNEPSYEYYFKQFVYFDGQRGSQWNGPSWPYQSSQAITGMANFLNNYSQDLISKSDYLKLLRLYTRQHYLPDGKINLVENYDPNLGGPIVYYYWSNHYNHSSYNNLVISGLCGIRPSAGDTLTINPLTDESIDYFFLDDIRYHGHKISIVYDREGTHYKAGKGLTVYLDGKKVASEQKGGKYAVYIGPPLKSDTKKAETNLALNIHRTGYPVASTSINSYPDSVFQAIDGKIWYFKEISNRWTTAGSITARDWLQITFEEPKPVSAAVIHFYADEKFALPAHFQIEYWKNNDWIPVTISDSINLKANTATRVSFGEVNTDKIRLVIDKAAKPAAIVELELY